MTKDGSKLFVLECDIIILHFLYGPFVIEVKGTPDVVEDSRPSSSHKSYLDEAAKQLLTRRMNLQEYVKDFFKENEIRAIWNEHLKADVNSIIKELFNNWENRNRSISCLFGETDVDNKKGNVLQQNELKDYPSFKEWFKKFLENQQELACLEHHNAVFEIMLNRCKFIFHFANVFLMQFLFQNCSRYISKSALSLFSRCIQRSGKC